MSNQYDASIACQLERNLAVKRQPHNVVAWDSQGVVKKFEIHPRLDEFDIDATKAGVERMKYTHQDARWVRKIVDGVVKFFVLVVG